MSEVEDKSAPATTDEKTQIKWYVRCKVTHKHVYVHTHIVYTFIFSVS